MIPTDEVQDEETVVEVDLETVVEEAIAEFDYVASITITHHPTYERPGGIIVKIHTGEADDFEDYRQLFSSEHKIAINRADETLLVPFEIMATLGGPETWDNDMQTTIYNDENVLGAQPVQLDDGVAYLRDKLEKPEQWNQHQTERSLDRIQNYTD